MHLALAGRRPSRQRRLHPAPGTRSRSACFVSSRTLGHHEVTRRLGGPTPPPDTAALLGRRAAVFGTALAPLTYADPLHLASGSGATMTDTSGRTFIDAYNNVPVVGHAHPRVSGAIADQARLLSTNLRYLHPRAIELAERLVATMPAGLDTVLLVNSGSEAVDLAWRLATAATGRTGALVTDFAYHGVTTATAALSPEEWRGGWRPAHVERYAAPRGARPDPASFDEAVGRLRRAGHEPAMVVVDTLYTSDGILAPGRAYHAGISAAARAAGALVVADEVQAGFGRTGDHLWSFVGAGLEPDVVTLGKPMGNGYPIAAVVTRSQLRRGPRRRGGVLQHVRRQPGGGRGGARRARRHRGRRPGLARSRDGPAAAEPVAGGHGRLRGRARRTRSGPPGRRRPGRDVARTSWPPCRTGPASRGVLIGTTGPRSDVLKIRPPLPITAAQVKQVADTVARRRESRARADSYDRGWRLGRCRSAGTTARSPGSVMAGRSKRKGAIGWAVSPVVASSARILPIRLANFAA